MAIALVANTAKIQTPNYGSNTTSSAIDTTGANLIVIAISFYGSLSGNFTSITDSKSNTWTALNTYTAADDAGIRMFYCLNPTVGSGHTFTLNVSSTYAGSFYVAAFSGVASFDKQGGALSAFQPGSLTATTASSLYVTAFGASYATTTSRAVDSSFTITDSLEFISGQGCAGALAYKISSAAENPTWSRAAGSGKDASMAIFAPSAGGGGGTPQNITVSQAVLSFNGFALGVNAKSQLAISKASLIFAGFPEGINAKSQITMTRATLVLQGSALTMNAKSMLTLQLATISFAGRAVTLTQNVTLQVGQASLQFNGRAIDIGNSSGVGAYLLALLGVGR